MELVKYMNGPLACFSRVKLASGEQVMVSIAPESVWVVRMAMGGIVPRERIWECDAWVQMGLMLRCAHTDRGAVLDGLTAEAMTSPSIDALHRRLQEMDAATRPWSRTED